MIPSAMRAQAAPYTTARGGSYEHATAQGGNEARTGHPIETRGAYAGLVDARLGHAVLQR